MENSQKQEINLPEKNLPIEPLTLEELREAAEKRIDVITKEFKDGFDFIGSFPKSVTFFGSAQLKETNEHYKRALSIAKRITKELGYSIVTGGGPGIMEAANRGSNEENGNSLGLTIKLPHNQATNPYVKGHADFYYFFIRKVCLSFAAEAYIFLPGGYGTMDEFFEIMTLVQTKKIPPVPIILVGNEYWKNLESFIKTNMLKDGLINEADLSLYTITEDEDEIINIVKNSPVRNGIRYKGL